MVAAFSVLSSCHGSRQQSPLCILHYRMGRYKKCLAVDTAPRFLHPGISHGAFIRAHSSGTNLFMVVSPRSVSQDAHDWSQYEMWRVKQHFHGYHVEDGAHGSKQRSGMRRKERGHGM